jgi:nicotinamidase-related amidase
MTARHRLLDRRDAALLVIDVQRRINDAMADQGHLIRVTTLVDACRYLEVPIIATEQYPKGLGSTVDVLAARLPEQPLIKETFSCARDRAVHDALTASGCRQLVAVGIEAHVCVLQTVLDLLDGGYQVHVPHDAVNSRRGSDRSWAMYRMAEAGAAITSTESALFELLERCATDDFRTVSKMIREIPVEDREESGARSGASRTSAGLPGGLGGGGS